MVYMLMIFYKHYLYIYYKVPEALYCLSIFKVGFMVNTIVQKVVFTGISPQTLYNTYMDAKEHSKAIGAKVSIQKETGIKFTSHNGYITGKTFQLIKDKLIVQSWRGSDWNKTDVDSTFILQFEQKGKNGILRMVHANIPDRFYAGIKDGWNQYYWKLWKEYFAGQKKKK